jgi:hypothetical protein
MLAMLLMNLCVPAMAEADTRWADAADEIADRGVGHPCLVGEDRLPQARPLEEKPDFDVDR